MEPLSAPLLGIGLATLSAAALAIGNLLQARGVHTMRLGTVRGTGGSQVGRLVRNRVWLGGGALLGVAIVLQMGSLTFAPLMVVQPVGVTALVFTAIVTAVIAKRSPAADVIRAIGVCVVGVAGFVTVAALVSTQHAITDVQLIAVLSVLGVVLVLTGLVWFLGRHRRTAPIVWVLLGGIFSAFVATLGKTVILRVQAAIHAAHFTLDAETLLTIACLLGIGVAGGLSIYLVQRAHASNRPEVVVAGLTVVDPVVAVILGIAILGEASTAPPWAFLVFVVAGAVAIAGVFALSRAESAREQ